MHASTIDEHQKLTSLAKDLVSAWIGTGPMTSAAQVHEALLAGGYEEGEDELVAFEPYVIDACRERGLLVEPVIDTSKIQYAATFSRRSDIDEATLSTIRQTEDACSRGDLLSLAEVCDVCATFKVSASVFDANNRPCGRVDAKGEYTLI